MTREQDEISPAGRKHNNAEVANSTPLNKAAKSSINREGRMTAETAMLIRDNQEGK